MLFVEVGFSRGQLPAEAKQSIIKGDRCLGAAKRLCSFLGLLEVLLLGLSPWSLEGMSSREGAVGLKASSNGRMSNEGSPLSLCLTSAFSPPFQ